MSIMLYIYIIIVYSTLYFIELSTVDACVVYTLTPPLKGQPQELMLSLHHIGLGN